MAKNVKAETAIASGTVPVAAPAAPASAPAPKGKGKGKVGKPAKMPKAATMATSASRVDPASVHVMPGFNIRQFDASGKDEMDARLMASIRATGIENPLTVRNVNGKMFVISGHRRLAAVMALRAMGAEIRTIPVVLDSEDKSDMDRTLSLWTSNEGKPLSNVEKGMIVARLRVYGWSDAEIAEKFGVEPRYVAEYATAVRMTSATKKLVAEGLASFTTAAEIAKRLNAAEQDALAASLRAKAEAEQKQVSLTQAKKLADAAGTPIGKPAKAGKGKPDGAPGSAPMGKPDAAPAGKPGTAPVRITGADASYLQGPFVAKGNDILDRAGIEVCTARTVGAATEVARLLTLACATVGERGADAAPAAKAAPDAAPAAPASDAAPAAKAAPAAPRKMADHGNRKPVKPAPDAAPAAPVGKPAKAGKGKPAN